MRLATLRHDGSTRAAVIRQGYAVLLDDTCVGKLLERPDWRETVAGIVGAGGGFLVVPALVLLGGLPMSVAVGTSLLVIAMKSFAGLAGYLPSVSLDWPLVLGVTAAAVAGSFVGARLAGVIPEQALRKGFGFFVLGMAVLVLVQELAVPLWAVGALVGVLALAAAVCWFTVRSCPLHRSAVAATAP